MQHRYGSRLVLDIDQITISRGETLAIIGPSGSGKSTLLRLLQFLERPGAGKIMFAGQVVEGEVPLDMRRRITTVFQRPMLLDRSVRENVIYGLRLRGQGNGREQADRFLGRLGLTELAEAPARSLSGGEAQRVAFARALAFEPEVLLLDEPTANLDPYHVGLIEGIIREQHQRGVTIVLVTHQVFQARRLADRTALILDGRLIEVAATAQLLDSPRDHRVRAFVNGEMVY
jgi:tungstate transport system ATP-binding protein